MIDQNKNIYRDKFLKKIVETDPARLQTIEYNGTKYDKKGWEQSVDAILDILKVHYYPKIKELYDTECK